MQLITKSTFQFLKDLKQNNDREWFNANRSRYETAKLEFEQYIDALIGEIVKFDDSIAHFRAKDCIFRIHRDIRFSKDKSPYKVNFGAHITSASKKSEIHSRAGYYIHLEPGKSMLAGGAYLPQGSWLKNIRQEIDQNAEALKQIVNSEPFKQYFGAIEGEKLKTVPRNYSKDHPEIELLRHKSFLAIHHCNDEQVLSKEFLEHSVNVFKVLKPFDEFLNNAIKDPNIIS